MAIGKKIKGITIEFLGDTSKLGTALKEIDSKAKGVDKSLREVDRALKFNPGNVELLAQKQQLLGQKVTQTKDRLEALRRTQAKLDEDKSVDKTSQDYQELRREIIETESKLKHFTAEAQKLSNVKLTALGNQMKSVGNGMKNVGRNMTQYVTAPIAGGVAAAVKTTLNFDDAMSQVAATMGLTVGQMKETQVSTDGFSGSLRDLAIEMGSKTSFSATQAAEALNYMALAGYDAQTSAEMLPGVLNLAAAGNMDLANASDMLTDSQSALGLSMEETQAMIDKMAKTSSKSNTSVEQLGAAILTVGGTAKSMAGGTTELNAVLGVLADNGVKGAEGGTALRNILLSLGSPTDKAAKALEDLGVSVYDAQGNMRDLRELMPEMAGALDKLTGEERTQALASIFNKRDLKSVNALLATSKDRFNELSGAIDNSGGAAAQMAETQLNNLKGSLTILKSALEGMGISVGDVLTPYIRSFAEFITGLVTKFNELSPAAQKIITFVGLGVAALGPLVFIGGSFVTILGNTLTYLPLIGSKLAAVSKIFGLAKTAIGLVSGALRGLFALMLANPITLVIAAIAALVAAFVILWKKSATFRNFWKSLWAGIKNIVKSVVDWLKATFSGLPDKMKTIGKNVVTGLWNGIKGAAGWLKEKIKGFVDGAISWFKDFFGIGSPSKEMADQIGKWIPAGLSEGITANLGGLRAAVDTMGGAVLEAPSMNFAGMTDEISNAIGTGLAIQGSGAAIPSSINIVVELGGTKVGEKIVKLYDYTKRAKG